MNLGLFVPTRGRPANAVRLARGVLDTADLAFTTLIFVVDHDDPELREYELRLGSQYPWAQLKVVPPGAPQRMGPVLNWAVTEMGGGFTHLGFMGDDHLPVTRRWDHALTESLEGRPGVAYGNDLFQSWRLPTAAVISSDIVAVLGYMSAPPLEHLYIDDFWKMLGEVTRLVYRNDIIIEHLHPAAGKGVPDAGYAANGSALQFAADKARFDDFVHDQWPRDLEKLREALRL